MRASLLALTLLLAIPSTGFSLTIGTITKKPSNKVNKFLPVAEYIEKKLKEKGIEEEVKVKFAKDIPHMVNLVREGKIDLLFESLYPVLSVCSETHCSGFLKRWKNGLEYYHTIIFTRADSVVTNLTDLKGRKIAFDQPFSTSGYFIPRIFLEKKGIKLIQLKSIQDVPPPDKAGYFFTGDEESVVAYVYLKKTDAGAIDHERFTKIAKEKSGNFRILLESPPIPRQLVAFRNAISKNLEEKVKNILLNMHREKEGKEALRRFNQTHKFTKLKEEDIELITQLSKAIKRNEY